MNQSGHISFLDDCEELTATLERSSNFSFFEPLEGASLTRVVGVPHRGPRPLDGLKSSIQAKFAPRACQVRPTWPSQSIGWGLGRPLSTCAHAAPRPPNRAPRHDPRWLGWWWCLSSGTARGGHIVRHVRRQNRVLKNPLWMHHLPDGCKHFRGQI